MSYICPAPDKSTTSEATLLTEINNLANSGAGEFVRKSGGVLVNATPGGGLRVVTTTDDATSVINIDTTDVYELSAVANATTFSTTGSPTDGQKLMIRFKDAGVAKGLT